MNIETKTLDLLVENWYAAVAMVELAEKEKEEAAAALMAAMDAAEVKRWISGDRTVTRVKDSMITTYDYKKLDAENPGLRDKYSFKKHRAGYLKK